MRVISGIARGCRLTAPRNCTVRPMLDRVKESMFNILRDAVGGARVLDLFSGSGSLGIEALSRGAALCVFIERDERLVRAISSNLSKSGLETGAVIVKADAMSGPAGLQLPVEPFNLVFCDPPYETVDNPVTRTELCNSLENWIEYGAFADDVTVVIHHGPPATILWPFRRLEPRDRRCYGKSVLSFFRMR